jgi:hypothetical protein
MKEYPTQTLEDVNSATIKPDKKKSKIKKSHIPKILNACDEMGKVKVIQTKVLLK